MDKKYFAKIFGVIFIGTFIILTAITSSSGFLLRAFLNPQNNLKTLLLTIVFTISYVFPVLVLLYFTNKHYTENEESPKSKLIRISFLTMIIVSLIDLGCFLLLSNPGSYMYVIFYIPIMIIEFIILAIISFIIGTIIINSRTNDKINNFLKLLPSITNKTIKILGIISAILIIIFFIDYYSCGTMLGFIQKDANMANSECLGLKAAKYNDDLYCKKANYETSCIRYWAKYAKNPKICNKISLPEDRRVTAILDCEKNAR